MGEKRRNISFNTDTPKGKVLYEYSKTMNFNRWVLEQLEVDMRIKKHVSSTTQYIPEKNM